MNTTTVLVTGGTGFVGIHIILQLLQQGYKVRTTLRTLSRKDEILSALKEGGATNIENLSFYEADLTHDAGWDEAVAGCNYVLHVASPFPLAEPEDENELIIPARDGALRVLKSSKSAGVKRVVITSSFAAVGYGPKRAAGYVFTEEDWTDERAPIMAYLKSKTVAEKAAWSFIQKEGGSLELSVINPVAIFGPMLGGITSASLEGVIKTIVEGKVKESPSFTFGVVDVRDVADIHIKAMLSPAAAGQRFLASAEGVMSFYDVAKLIRKERPQKATQIGEMTPTDESFYIQMSSRKAIDTLRWRPRSKEEAVLASVDSVK